MAFKEYTKDGLPKDKYGLVWRKKPRSEGGNWTYDQKLKIAATFVACGSPTLTATLTGCSVHNINRWRRELWWRDMCNELIITEKVETNKKLKNITEKALGVVMDTLIDGNYQYDQKLGKIVRVPVNARDANKIAMDMLDRQELLEKRVEHMQGNEAEKTVDTLQKLADTFAKLVEGENKKRTEKTINVEIEDVTVLDTDVSEET